MTTQAFDSPVVQAVDRHRGEDIWTHILVCPVCGFDYVRITTAVASNNYTNKDNTLLSIDCEGECGHTWAICLTFHKGQTFLHARSDGDE